MSRSSLQMADERSETSLQRFQIGELAKKTGKSKRALRLYEELGLLSPICRSDGGFRLYGAAALEQVRWISNLQELGLSLQNIQAVVENAQQESVPRDSMNHARQLLEERLEDVQAQIGKLNVLRRDLKHTLSYLEACRGCDVEHEGVVACLSCGSQSQNVPPLLRGISRCAAQNESAFKAVNADVDAANTAPEHFLKKKSSSVEVDDVHR